MAKSKIPEPERQLDVTVYAADTKGGLPLTGEAKKAVIHRLIEKFDGIQDHALGTVVIPLLEESGVTVQLWIHEWE